MKRPRPLSAEERTLWDQVASRAKPLHPTRPTPSQSAPTPPLPKLTDKKPATPSVSNFKIEARIDHHGTHDLLPSLTEQMGRDPVRMDRKKYTQMKRGKLAPERRLDLHGMTLAQAHPELVHFILSSQAAGKRLVLVITGKGKDRDTGGPIPTRYGVLRHQVPQWMSRPPLSNVVLQITPASQKHGGHGAYYVYLRR